MFLSQTDWLINQSFLAIKKKNKNKLRELAGRIKFRIREIEKEIKEINDLEEELEK